jgi:hypothetical protein
MSTDTMSRAVATLHSDGSRAWLACSQCGKPALSIAKEAMGLGQGVWTSCKSSSSEQFLMRVQTQGMKMVPALLVRSTHVVISAQHLYHAGIEHALLGKGFPRPIATLSVHYCREHAAAGESVRLTPDARAGLDVEAPLVNTKIEGRALDAKYTRLLCCSGSPGKAPCGGKAPCDGKAPCGGTVAKGELLPWRAGSGALPIAQMLYFSRKSAGIERGIVVWVVDHTLPVVVLSDYAKLFTTGEGLRTLNGLCREHVAVFPRKCVVCNGDIMSEKDAVCILGDNQHTAHASRCSQPCKRCAVSIPKVAPTLDEAMDCERAVAVDACCSYCANSTDEVGSNFFKQQDVVQRSEVGSNFFKQQDVVQRSGQKRTGNRLQPQAHVAVGDIFARRAKTQNTGGVTEIDGLEPGAERVVFRSDNTVARKRNVNGRIEYLPLDGEPFREKDGRIELYECGRRCAPSQ